jgi:hypothetical protein
VVTTPAGSGLVGVRAQFPLGILGFLGNTGTTLANAFTYLASLTSLVPNTGTAEGGVTVTVNGAGFVPGNGNMVLTFNGSPVTIRRFISSTQFQFDPPTVTTASPVAGIPVTVALTVQGRAAANTLTYTYRPAVTRLSATQGPATVGTPVTVTDNGFGPAGTPATVTVGGVSATAVAVISPTSLSFTTPPGQGSDPVVVTINNVASDGAETFGYVPVISGLSQSVGPASGGTLITVTGAGFIPQGAGTIGTYVRFAGNAALATFIDASTVTVTTPAGVGRAAVDVRVITAGGTFTSPTGSFNFDYKPVITAITPPVGGPAGGNVSGSGGWRG